MRARSTLDWSQSKTFLVTKYITHAENRIDKQALQCIYLHNEAYYIL